MRDTIEKLRNGSILPVYTCGADSQEIEELVQLIQRNKEDLNREVNEQQKEILEKLLDCFEEYIFYFHA